MGDPNLETSLTNLALLTELWAPLGGLGSPNLDNILTTNLLENALFAKKNRGQHNRILNFPVLRLCYIPAEPSVLRPRRVTRMHHPSHVPVVADYIIGDALRWGSDAPPVGGGLWALKARGAHQPLWASALSRMHPKPPL